LDRHVVSLRSEHRRRHDAMVAALRKYVPAGQLRYAIPEGGLYLWCQLCRTVLADAVLQRALREAIVFVSGAPFYCDRDGAQDLRICYAGQPPVQAARAAKCLGRSIGE
jgi:2-aminoadipate transaminase